MVIIKEQSLKLGQIIIVPKFVIYRKVKYITPEKIISAPIWFQTIYIKCVITKYKKYKSQKSEDDGLYMRIAGYYNLEKKVAKNINKLFESTNEEDHKLAEAILLGKEICREDDPLSEDQTFNYYKKVS